MQFHLSRAGLWIGRFAINGHGACFQTKSNRVYSLHFWPLHIIADFGLSHENGRTVSRWWTLGRHGFRRWRNEY